MMEHKILPYERMKFVLSKLFMVSNHLLKKIRKVRRETQKLFEQEKETVNIQRIYEPSIKTDLLDNQNTNLHNIQSDRSFVFFL